jgi:hypothetical protein
MNLALTIALGVAGGILLAGLLVVIGVFTWRPATRHAVAARNAIWPHRGHIVIAAGGLLVLGVLAVAAVNARTQEREATERVYAAELQRRMVEDGRLEVRKAECRKMLTDWDRLVAARELLPDRPLSFDWKAAQRDDCKRLLGDDPPFAPRRSWGMW